jgi:hypothetical protein
MRISILNSYARASIDTSGARTVGFGGKSFAMELKNNIAEAFRHGEDDSESEA